MAKTKKEVIEYYDEYTTRQINMGINARHESIQNWLVKSGLLPEHDVLEIGCGIGTQTELLSRYLNKNSKITAVDISPKSVEIAKKRINYSQQVKWVAQDFVKWKHSEKYDVILLPDVIEHIPINLHGELFKKLTSNLKEDGFILIHIPNPLYLEWCEINTPEKLQVIDQAIHTDDIVKNTYPYGLYIHFLSTYKIWVDNCDYTVIVLKNRKIISERKYKIILPHVSIITRVKSKFKRIFKR